MKLLNGLSAIALTLSAGSANAGVIINSIELTMADSEFSARAGSSDLTGNLQNDFDSATEAVTGGGRLCSQSLEAFDGVTASGNCGLGTRNNGAMYEISGSTSGSTLFQFGLDWGRGGFLSVASSASQGSDIVGIGDDIWWARSWVHGDVINYVIAEQSSFTLTLIGFEGCCDGINSARYTVLNEDDTLMSLTGAAQSRAIRQMMGGVEQGTQWTTLAVNSVNAVPVPGSLPLLALGAGLLALRRNGGQKSA